MSWTLLLLVALALGTIVSYNGLVRLRAQADGAWADIDVQLKRRYDLIPNVQLQATLGALENSIQNARRCYNAVVRDFNTSSAQVPSNIVARMFRFQERDFFEIEEAEREAPRVRFEDRPAA